MAIVRYLVNNVSSTLEFYTKNLSFVLKEQFGENFAKIQLNDLEVWISGPKTSAAKPMSDGQKPVPGGWNRIVVKVKNIENKVQELQKAGVKMRNDILSGVGGKQIVIEDPSGNPIEIFE